MLRVAAPRARFIIDSRAYYHRQTPRTVSTLALYSSLCTTTRSLSRFTLTETCSMEGHYIDASVLHFQCKKSLPFRSLHAKFLHKSYVSKIRLFLNSSKMVAILARNRLNYILPQMHVRYIYAYVYKSEKNIYKYKNCII